MESRAGESPERAGFEASRPSESGLHVAPSVSKANAVASEIFAALGVSPDGALGIDAIGKGLKLGILKRKAVRAPDVAEARDATIQELQQQLAYVVAASAELMKVKDAQIHELQQKVAAAATSSAEADEDNKRLREQLMRWHQTAANLAAREVSNVKDSKVARMKPEDQRQLWQSGKARWVSGLLDDSDWKRLIESLWVNAGQPSNASSKPIDEVENKWDFFRDRRNWSKGNLTQLYKHHEATGCGMQELSRLQLHTSHGFVSVLKQPIRTLSLLKSANNMSPFSEYLRPVDRSDMVSAAHRSTYFLLSKDAFKSGSEHVSREDLEELWKAFESAASRGSNPEAESDRNPDMGGKSAKMGVLSSLFMKASPVCAISKNARGRELAGVRPDAKFFCYVYAKRKDVVVSWITSKAEEIRGDSFLQFLRLGGFLYFDWKFDIIDIHSLSFLPPDPGSSRHSVSKIFFGNPCPLPLCVVQPLHSLDRFSILGPGFLQNSGFTHMAYMLPSEFLGDSVFPKDGGFAYYNKNAPKKSLFFPFVVPGDDDGLQLQENNPVVYNSPLYVPGLSDTEQKEESSQEEGPVADSKFLAEMRHAGEATDMVFASAQDAANAVEKRLGWNTMQELMQHSENLEQKGKDLVETLESLGNVDETVEPENENKDLEELVKWLKAPNASESSDFLGFLEHMPKMRQIATKMLLKLVETDMIVSRSSTLRESWGHGAQQEQSEVCELGGKERQRFEYHELKSCIPLAMEVLMHLVAELQHLRGSIPNNKKDMQRWEAAVKQWRDSAHIHIENAEYVMCEEEPSMTRKDCNDGSKVVRDRGRDKIGLLHFCCTEEVRECMLDIEEVAALRFYTSTSFGLINTPLRNSTGCDRAKQPKHPLSLMTYFITSGLKKLRALNFKRQDSANEFLWRGLKDRSVSEHFLLSGGCEMACMSTSSNIDVVTSYSRSRTPLFFRMKIESPMDRGASLRWLSMFPHEDEVLYPPMTCVQPLYQQPIDNSSGSVVTVRVSFPS